MQDKISSKMSCHVLECLPSSSSPLGDSRTKDGILVISRPLIGSVDVKKLLQRVNDHSKRGKTALGLRPSWMVVQQTGNCQDTSHSGRAHMQYEAISMKNNALAKPAAGFAAGS